MRVFFRIIECLQEFLYLFRGIYQQPAIAKGDVKMSVVQYSKCKNPN